MPTTELGRPSRPLAGYPVVPAGVPAVLRPGTAGPAGQRARVAGGSGGGPGGPGGPGSGPGIPTPFGPAGRIDPRSRQKAGLILAGRIISTVLSVAVLAGFAFYWGFARNASANVADSNGVQSAGSAGVVFSGGANILIVGSDARTDADGNPLNAEELAAIGTTLDNGGVNTDTIIVLHIPQGGGKATAVSLPRDTYIPRSVTDTVQGPYDDGTQGTYKPNKINSFYGTAKFYTENALQAKGEQESPARERKSDEAGRTMLIKIVQAFTGVKIDHYAEVNLIGFYTLSNAIGGVPVCLNAAVKDSFSGADFKAGPQEVSGSAAMAFVRQRHGLPNGDLDRVRRQQAFLAGATSKMLSAGILTSPTKLSQLSKAADKALTLDSGFDLLTFASQMAGLSGGNVTFTTIPTHGADPAADSDALKTDPAEIRSFFSTVTGSAASTSAAGTSAAGTSKSSGDVAPASVTVDVQDATSGHNAGTPVMDKLGAAGFERGQNVDFDGGSRDSTTIAYPKGAEAAAKLVQSSLGGAGALAEDASVTKGHVVVVVGADLAGSGLRRAGLAIGAAPAIGPAPAVGAAPAAGQQQAAPTGSGAATSGSGTLSAGAVGCVN